MIKWKRIVNESIDEKSFKKLLRQNGVTKLPSGTKLSYDGKLEWSKHKGHAGQKTIRNMCIQLEHAGWKRGDWTTGGIPDGSSVANSQTYTSPDGKILMSYTEYYGCTSYDNSFYITFKLVESGVNESTIKGTGRVDFDDDLVAVYDTKGKLEYKGLFDDCPYKDEPMQYDRKNMVYRFEGENGDYRTMAKLAESRMRYGDMKRKINENAEEREYSIECWVPCNKTFKVMASDSREAKQKVEAEVKELLKAPPETVMDVLKDAGFEIIPDPETWLDTYTDAY